MSKVKRYIPELVYEKVNQLNFKNKEHLYIICDMIIRQSIYKKQGDDYSNQFVDIPSYYFRDIITDFNYYNKAMKCLQDNKIIICDNLYSKLAGKALGYKFNDSLISKVISVELNSKPISKNIMLNRNKRLNLVADKYKLYKDHFIKTFGIDYENAIKWIDLWFKNENQSIYTILPLCSMFLDKNWVKSVNKYNALFISISAINDGELFFRKNQSNGRIDTNLTNLKSELKQFITIKDLRQVDIVNSQPFLLSLLILPLCSMFLEKNEVERYVLWVKSGKFYENFEREYFNKTEKILTRKQIKDMMFCIFYSKNGSYQKEKNIFNMLFPTIGKWITEQKKNKHNEFALKLQNIESSICIDCVCSKLDTLGIKYYTIHDAWLVDKNDANEVINVIEGCFNKMYKTSPKLKVDKIN